MSTSKIPIHQDFISVGAIHVHGVGILDQDPSLPLVCDLLGVTNEQMNNVLEHKTFEDPLTETIIHRPQLPLPIPERVV